MHIMKGLILFASSASLNEIPLLNIGITSPIKEILPMNVLVIDDNEIVRRALVRQLEKIVLKIIECEDGMKGLEEYQKNKQRFDFVIVDYQMPQMSGIEVIKEIRNIEKDNRVPIMRIF